MKRNQGANGRGGNRRNEALGFSAIEVTMVATVIAILALVALPVYMKKMEEARLNSTIDEMKELSTALVMAKADTSEYPRLQDLDNTTGFVDANGDNVPDNNLEDPEYAHVYVPSAYWNDLFFNDGGSERAILALRWKGPYVTYQQSRSIAIYDIRYSEVFRELLSNPSGGPVPYHGIWRPSDDLDRYPVDAWGTPYIFFGTGPTIYDSPSETGFLVARIFSCGPDGLPGDGGAFDAANLRPWEIDGTGGLLGEPDSDDIIRHVE
ncbi:hypothetical protein JXA32_04270 [Candidatus Sumerlaeota bacterium]|nr:hypothetical protein [Candidatus Sumerlaeota bacterium]